MQAGPSIRRARQAAGLSQRELARRAVIDQGAIARIEQGQTQPRVDTFTRLLEACGWELRTMAAPSPDLDRWDIRKSLRMPDAERERYFIDSNRNMLRMFDSGRQRAATFDPLAIIRVLNAHRVRFVVVGGVAAGVQGAAWATTDLDICYARGTGYSDYERLGEALAALEARPVETSLGTEVHLDARTLAASHVLTLVTHFGRLDCLDSPAPGMVFETLEPSARRIEGSETYLVASVDDLIEMRRVAGRPKDLIGVELLRALKEEIAASTSAPELAGRNSMAGAQG